MLFKVSHKNQTIMKNSEVLEMQKDRLEQNKALVKRILEEGDKYGTAILDEVCSPSYKMYFPGNAKPISLDEHKMVWQTFIDAFPDLNHEIIDFIAEGDKVSTREILRGTHKGEFEGIPPTGNKFEMSAICVWRFSNGKLEEYWADADILGLIRQLGIELMSRNSIEKQNKELLGKYYTDLDAADFDGLAEFLNKYITSDFILHLPGGINIKGREGLKEYYANSMKAFFNSRHSIDDVIAEGDKVAFRATSSAIHRGHFMNIPPTENEIKVTFNGFWKVQKDMIAEWWSEYDALSMMQQLGMELKMKE
jgi:predicted ester cyclase